MKKVLATLLTAALIICVFSVNAFASGGMSVSTGSLSLKPGESTSFTVSASNCAGSFSVSSSDSSVATASVSGDTWLDNSSATINVTAKNAGTAVITIRATDMATYDDEDISGQTRTVTINVAAPATTTTTKASNTTTTTSASGATTTTTTAKADATTTTEARNTNELSEAVIVAGKRIPLNLAPGTYEYDVTVPYGSNTVIVDAVAGETASKVEVVGAENISDGSVVTIVVTGKDDSVTNYHVKVHYEEPQIKEVPAESQGLSRGTAILLALAAFLLGLILGAIIGFLIGKKKYESYEYYGGDNGGTPSYPSYDDSASTGAFNESADDDGYSSVTPFATTGFNFSSGMGLNYDYNKNYEDDGYYAEDEAVSLRDPVYTEPEYEPAPAIEEPADIPPAFEAAPAEEPAAPVAVEEPADTPPAFEPAPVEEPAPAASPSEFLAAMNASMAAMNGGVAEPIPAATPEPVAAPADDLVPEPMAQPYIDDAPPALPYEPGKAFGSVPFEQSAD